MKWHRVPVHDGKELMTSFEPIIKLEIAAYPIKMLAQNTITIMEVHCRGLV